jgi:hypothetical protein
MTHVIDALNGGVKIRSCADKEGFGISAIAPGKQKVYQEFSGDSYEALLKQLWTGYLVRGKQPELLGHEIPHSGLIGESLHYIAPNSFYIPSETTPLAPRGERFLHWLKSQEKDISARMGEIDYDKFSGELDDILRIHLDRKYDKKR